MSQVGFTSSNRKGNNSLNDEEESKQLLRGFTSSRWKGYSSLDDEGRIEMAALRFYFFQEEGNISLDEERNQHLGARKKLPRGKVDSKGQQHHIEVLPRECKLKEIEHRAMCVASRCDNVPINGFLKVLEVMVAQRQVSKGLRRYTEVGPASVSQSGSTQDIFIQSLVMSSPVI